MENAVLAGMFSVLSGILAQPDSKERTAALLILGAAFAEVGAPSGFILALQEAASRVTPKSEDLQMASEFIKEASNLLRQVAEETEDRINELVKLYGMVEA